MVVLDTNIILLDANNIFNFGPVVVIPETVVDELDSKKSEPGELGYQSRQFGRLIAKSTSVGVRHRTPALTESVFESDGVELIIVSTDDYPDFSDSSPSIRNDRRIIYIAQQYPDATFTSNDVMARIRAKAVGIEVSDFKSVEAVDFEFTKQLEVPLDLFSCLHKKPIDMVDKQYKPENYNYIFTTPDSSQVKLATISNGFIEIVGKETEKELRRQDISPINAEQLLLSVALQDTSVDLAVVEALSGSGFN